MSEDTTTDSVTEETTEEDTTAQESTDTPEEPDDKEEQWDPERVKRKIAKLNSEAANLRKRLTDAPKAEDVAAKDTRIGSLETDVMRLSIALELGLPKEIASRLQGKDRDEMVADAEQLLELVAPAKRPSRRPTEAMPPGVSGDREPEETNLTKLGERMFRN